MQPPTIQQFRKGCFGNLCAFISAFGKIVLPMRRNCYFRASGQNSDTAVGFGDPDFLYDADILAID